ncbi:MAG: peptidoglycan DD-metalloendopeptidase family protein [Campylobacterales bacterium]|nr:peptidoglycan DD-metalloendopeptidase family protein [Campylobacterales bacterium]
MKKLLILLLMFSTLYGARVMESNWKKGETFSQYLERNNIPSSLLDTISKSDKLLLLEIQSGDDFFELKSNKNELLQALIPIGEEMQVQIVKIHSSGEYQFDIVPTIFIESEYKVVLPITNSPSVDINREINYASLANHFSELFKNRKEINFRRLQKGDTMAFFYTQRTRLGKPINDPQITSAMLETRGKKHFVFVNKDGEKFSDTGKIIHYKAGTKKVAVYDKMRMPMHSPRITSRFTYKRFHPVLKRYRPHLGIDFGARRGTPILAAGDGVVSFAGWQGGYGKVVKISHGGGYTTLYAHQSRIRVSNGQKVKKGQVIGYVGSTGRSTGPHLHFGMYINGRAVNPASHISIKTRKFKNVDIFKTKIVKIKGINKYKDRLLALTKETPKLHVWDTDQKNGILYKEINTL